MWTQEKEENVEKSHHLYNNIFYFHLNFKKLFSLNFQPIQYRYLPIFSSAVEQHHFDAATALRKDLQAAPAPAVHFDMADQLFLKAKKVSLELDFFLMVFYD
jgi:hypothetical protein